MTNKPKLPCLTRHSRNQQENSLRCRYGRRTVNRAYKDQIAGVLSCYDRIIVQGTVPGWCYAGGMTEYFYKHQIRIFDYPKWAEPLREELRANMERIAAG